MSAIHHSKVSLFVVVASFLGVGCGSSASSDDGESELDLGSVQEELCSGVKLTASTAGPVPQGTNVTLTASGDTCGAGETPEYRFLYKRDGTSRAVQIQAFGPSKTATFSTAGLPSGKYLLTVNVRAQGTTGAGKASTARTLFLGNVCNAVRLRATPKSPHPVSGSVTLTGTATCTGGTAEYRYLIKRGNTTMVQLRDWGPASFAWNTGAETPNLYDITVRARATGNTSVAESQATLPYRLGETCSLLSFTAAPPTSVPVGAHPNLTATASCTGTATPLFEFDFQQNGEPVFHVVRGFGDGDTPWFTEGLNPGPYTLRVVVHASDFDGVINDTKTMPYTLTPAATPTCTSVDLTTTPPSPQLVGTTVTLNGAATCSPGAVPQYAFFVRSPGSANFMTLQNFATTASTNWMTMGPTTGVFELRVDARAQGATAAQATRTINFTLNPLPPPPTWAQIYDAYFAPPSTPGHCNNCHSGGTPQTRFNPGTTKDTFYNELVARGFLNLQTPSASLFASPSSSMLRWINPSGPYPAPGFPMPFDNASSNDQAKNDIIAWANSGAPNNGGSGGGGTGGAGGTGGGGGTGGSGGTTGSGGDGAGGICGNPCGVNGVCCGDIGPDCSCIGTCRPSDGECQ